MIPHLDILVSLVSASVYILLVFKTRVGFLVGLANQGLWAVFMFQTHSYGLTYSLCFFVCTNLYGLRHWTRYPPKAQRWFVHPRSASAR